MKTMYIGYGDQVPDDNDPHFIIGVKDDDNADLDSYLKFNKNKVKLVKRFPETKNFKYLYKEPYVPDDEDDASPESHILQPAIIQLV